MKLSKDEGQAYAELVNAALNKIKQDENTTIAEKRRIVFENLLYKDKGLTGLWKYLENTGATNNKSIIKNYYEKIFPDKFKDLSINTSPIPTVSSITSMIIILGMKSENPLDLEKLIETKFGIKL